MAKSKQMKLKGLHKTFFKVPQISVKIKIYLNFYA